MIQTLFTVLITLAFLIVVLHDLVDIPGWTHGSQVRAALGPTKTIIGTLINGLFPGLAMVLAFYYWHKPVPAYALNYWVIYNGITMVGAITSWWIPYFRGTDEKTKELYSKMYAGTWQVLPAHGDNPRPNVLHLCFHALALTTLILSVLLWLGIR
jgi:hypothetical protein